MGDKVAKGERGRGLDAATNAGYGGRGQSPKECVCVWCGRGRLTGGKEGVIGCGRGSFTGGKEGVIGCGRGSFTGGKEGV